MFVAVRCVLLVVHCLLLLGLLVFVFDAVDCRSLLCVVVCCVLLAPWRCLLTVLVCRCSLNGFNVLVFVAG